MKPSRVLLGLVLHIGLSDMPVAVRELQEGDHICTPTFDSIVYHHGIVGRERACVYHFDKKKHDADYVFQGCGDCQARLNDQVLSRTNQRCVRKSCFDCFRQGQPIYRVEYEQSVASAACSAMGTQSTRTPRSANEVADTARALFENDRFGTYRLWTRNCEDFARFCKVGRLGSKQVRRAILIAALLTGNFPEGVAVYMALRGFQRLKNARRLRSVSSM